MEVRLFKPSIKEETISSVSDVLRSGWLGMGPKTAEFEKEFAKYVSAPCCLTTSSGTSALHLALKILQIPTGANVITTPITFISTNHTILYENLVPVFADVEPETGNLDIKSVESMINENTGAIIIVHYGGNPCALDEFYSLSKKYGIPIIEDCAHACGSYYYDRPIGSHDTLQAFSFDPTKNLTTGGGGALTFRSENYIDRLKCLRYMGTNKDSFTRFGDGGRNYDREYSVVDVGFRYHMNDIAAAIGLAQMKYLDQDNLRRKEIVDVYRSELADVPGLKLLATDLNHKSSNFLFAVLAESRNALMDKLKENGIGTAVHFKRCDKYPMYKTQELPNAEYFSNYTLSLPMYPDMTDDEIYYVTKNIKSGW
ncbi:MAG: DegT/DnrJ/EryC1/StrS family aminotransferase [Armatimonadota bacterium]